MTTGRTAGLLLALALVASVQVASEDPINYINMYIRLDEQGDYGLDKLTSTERSRLNAVFGDINGRLNDNLRNGALAYLKSNGWVELEIAGTETRGAGTAAGPQKLVVASAGGTGYLLEPRSLTSVQRGSYLAQLDSGRCRVITSAGNVLEFDIWEE